MLPWATASAVAGHMLPACL